MALYLKTVLLAFLVYLIYNSCTPTSDDTCKQFKAEIIQESPTQLLAIGYGTPPYLYEWSNGAHLALITVTDPGTYTVKVTDVNSCSATAVFYYNSSGCDTAGIKDVEGNYYKVITIGTQCWLKSNLRVSAGFPEIKDSLAWSKLTTPGWCYYRNDSSYAELYGKLYNGYAMESGKLCPKGWHIPTDAEWSILISALGGEGVAGEKMKNTGNLWENPNAATDSSGFSVFPAGRVQPNGSFIHLHQQAGIWSSTESAPGSKQYYYRGFANTTKGVFRIPWGKDYGFSCRCLKN